MTASGASVGPSYPSPVRDGASPSTLIQLESAVGPDRGNVPDEECGNERLDRVERKAAQPVETALPSTPGAAWRNDEELLDGKAMLSGLDDSVPILLRGVRSRCVGIPDIEPSADDPA